MRAGGGVLSGVGGLFRKKIGRGTVSEGGSEGVRLGRAKRSIKGQFIE